MLRLALILLLMLPLSLRAQEDLPETETSDNGFVINLIQDALSSETRQIRFVGVEGALSSQARIERITVADPEGVWLEIENASIDWTRAALFLGRLTVSELAAERIIVSRPPQGSEDTPAADSLPDPAEGSFSLPDLPVSVRIDRIGIDRIELAAPVIGQEAAIGLTASMVLEDGVLEADLHAERLDGTEGALDLAAAFSNQTEELTVDLDLREPAGGVLAETLNIEDRPALDLRLSGSGPLSDFAAELSLDADAARLVSGRIDLRETAEGRGFDLAVSGNIRPLIPALHRGFFAGEALVSARGLIPHAGGFRLDALLVSSAALQITGNAAFDGAGFPLHLHLTGRLASPDGTPTLVPGLGAGTTLRNATLQLSFPQEGTLTASLGLEDLQSDGFGIGAARLAFDGTGSLGPDPAERRLQGRLSGGLEALRFADAATREAIGERIELGGGLDWTAGAPLEIAALELSGNGVDLGLDGAVEAGVFDGALTAQIADLSPLSGLAGRDLRGEMSLAADGELRLLTGGFDLTLDGSSDGLGLGDPRLDPLLAGRTTLGGGLARDPRGFATRDFRLQNDRFDLRANGRYGLDDTDLDLTARLADLGLVTVGQANGPLSLEASATGSEASGIGLSAVILAPDTSLQDHRLQAGRVAFEGRLARNLDLDGAVSASVIFDGEQAALTGDIALTETAQALDGFSFVTRGLSLLGGIERDAEGLLTGALDLQAPDIAPTAALALTDAAGAVFASLELQPLSGRQNLKVEADIANFSYGDTALGSGRIEAGVLDLFGLPLADGEVQLRDARFGGIRLQSLSATADRTIDAMTLTAAALFENGTRAALHGALSRLDPGLRLALDHLTLERGEALATLRSEPVLEIVGDTISLTPLEMDIGDGALTLSGDIGEALALDLRAEAVPVAVVNAINPDLAAQGVIDGTAAISGSRTAPEAAFRLAVTDFTASALAALGLSPLTLSAEGQTDAASNLIDLAVSLTSQGGIEATARGTLPLPGGEAEADLDISLLRLPLAVLRPLSGVDGLSGMVTGQARVTGTFDDLAANYGLTGEGLTAAMLRQNGLPALNADIEGTYAGQSLQIARAGVSGPAGLSVTARGTVPLSGPGLNLSADGTLPLALANPVLVRSGLQVSGDLTLNAQATGQISAPVLSGRAGLDAGTLVVPLYNLRLNQISLDAALDGTKLVLNEARGRFAAGGKVIASGTVDLDPRAGLPADLGIKLDNAKIVDGSYLATELDGEISVTGPLTNAPLIAGDIKLDGTEIVLPERFSVSAGTLLEVSHRNPPQKVRMTLDRVRAVSRVSADSAASGPPARLDVRISSPNRIFIRGWGLDTELGGDLRIRGTLDDVQPVGQFDLIRGRIQILGQRLDFVEGRAVFEGNLKPRVLFRSTSQTGGYQVSLIVEGRLPEPDIRFESSPELPGDEVLALLLFERRLDELSPLQTARLAAAAASLRNGGRPGLTDSLRARLGFDNLDLTTGEDGEAGVAAGKYIDDEIYVELEARSDGGTRTTVTYDLTDRLRARGSLGSDGESSLGIYYERDY